MKKKILAIVTACALTIPAALSALTACNGEDTFNVVKTDKNYEYEIRGMSGATVDKGMVIDGKMDEGSYANLKKLELKKKVARETADIELTTFIGKSGIYIGVEVEESSTVYYNPKRTSAYNTGIECYFSLGKDDNDTLYEMDVTPGGQFSLRKMGNNGWTYFNYDYVVAPIYAMTAEGDLEGLTCHAWTAEVFLPYGVFNGRTSRPEKFYCTLAHNAPGGYTGMARTHYNFAVEQTSWTYATEREPETYPYVCDMDGYIYNDISFEVTGNGTVEERYGYERTLRNEPSRFVVTPAAGNILKSLVIDGKDFTEKIVNGIVEYPYTGKDVKVEAEFIPLESLKNVTLNLQGKKDGESAAVTGDKLTLVDADGNETTFDMTDGVATLSEISTMKYDIKAGTVSGDGVDYDWYGTILFESGKTEYDVTVGYRFFDLDLLSEASVDLSGVAEQAVTVTGYWVDHDPNLVTLRLPEDLGSNFTLETTVVLEKFTGATSRVSFAFSDSGNVYNIFNIGEWKIGAGDRRDLEQDGGEKPSETATKVGSLLRSAAGLAIRFTVEGSSVKVEMKLDGEHYETIETYSVTGNKQVQFIIGAGTWAFKNVTLTKNN